MQYRKYFKKYYGIDFSKDYDIHHIDLNHYNNDINNLMLIPKELHQRYHKCINSMDKSDVLMRHIITGNMVSSNNYKLQIIKQAIEIIEECNKWYDYKMYLDGKIGNIHNIKIGR